MSDKRVRSVSTGGGGGRRLTSSEQVCDESGQRLLQVELQQLDGLQTVSLLLLRRPPAAALQQSQVVAAVNPGKQLGHTGNSC